MAFAHRPTWSIVGMCRPSSHPSRFPCARFSASPCLRLRPWAPPFWLRTILASSLPVMSEPAFKVHQLNSGPTAPCTFTATPYEGGTTAPQGGQVVHHRSRSEQPVNQAQPGSREQGREHGTQLQSLIRYSDSGSGADCLARNVVHSPFRRVTQGIVLPLGKSPPHLRHTVTAPVTVADRCRSLPEASARPGSAQQPHPQAAGSSQ